MFLRAHFIIFVALNSLQNNDCKNEYIHYDSGCCVVLGNKNVFMMQCQSVRVGLEGHIRNRFTVIQFG